MQFSFQSVGLLSLVLILAGCASIDEAAPLSVSPSLRPSEHREALAHIDSKDCQQDAAQLAFRRLALGAPSLHHGRSVRELTKAEGRHQVLTLGYLSVVRTVKAEPIPVAAGEGCSGWRITYGWSSPQLHVASDFPADSCAFQHIYRHEMDHLAAYNDFLEQRRFAVAELAQRHLAKARDPESFGKAVSRLLDEVHLQHERLDRHHYADNQFACSGAIRKVAQREARRL